MSLVTQKWSTCIMYIAPLMEMDEPWQGCTYSASQTDISQVMFCLDNCTADCVNQDLSKYVATSVENLLHAHQSVSTISVRTICKIYSRTTEPLFLPVAKCPN